MNTMTQQTVLFDGSTMEARRALRLIAGTMSPRLVWQLQYDIESRQFYLNFLPIKVQRCSHHTWITAKARQSAGNCFPED